MKDAAMIKYLPFLLYFSISAMESNKPELPKFVSPTDNHSVTVNVETFSPPFQSSNPVVLNRQESKDSVSCSLKSSCLKEKKGIIFGGLSSLAFIITLVIHLTQC